MKISLWLIFILSFLSSYNKIFSQIYCDSPLNLGSAQREVQICDPKTEEISPWLSNDGLRVYFTKTNLDRYVEKAGIYQASRNNLTSQFSNAKLVCELPAEFNGNLGHSLVLTDLEDTIFINTYVAHYNKVFAYTRSSISQPFGNKFTIELTGSGIYSAKIFYVERNNSIVVLSADDGPNGYYNPVMKVFKRISASKYQFERKINPFDSIQMQICKNGISWIGQGKKSRITYKICSDPEMDNFQIGGTIQLKLDQRYNNSIISSINSCFSRFALIATYNLDLAYSIDILTFATAEVCNLDRGPTPEPDPENPPILDMSDIPNLILPFGAEQNRIFHIRGVNPGEITDFQVFNRWGKRIFQREIYEMNWPGAGVQSGIYFYSFRYKSRTYQGWVQVTD